MSSWETLLETAVATAVGAVVGSSFTLLGVLWSHRLSQAKALSELESQNHSMLQAFHDEIETLWENYMDTMGSCADSTPDGVAIEYYWPITQDYFTVYNQNASRLGLIKDHDLRKLVVATYASSKGLVDTYKLNNELLHRSEQAEWLAIQTKDPVDQQRAVAQKRVLTEYAAQVKKGHNSVKQKVQNLLRELRKSGVLSKN